MVMLSYINKECATVVVFFLYFGAPTPLPPGHARPLPLEAKIGDPLCKEETLTWEVAGGGGQGGRQGFRLD